MSGEAARQGIPVTCRGCGGRRGQLYIYRIHVAITTGAGRTGEEREFIAHEGCYLDGRNAEVGGHA